LSRRFANRGRVRAWPAHTASINHHGVRWNAAPVITGEIFFGAISSDSCGVVRTSRPFGGMSRVRPGAPVDGGVLMLSSSFCTWELERGYRPAMGTGIDLGGLVHPNEASSSRLISTPIGLDGGLTVGETCWDVSGTISACRGCCNE
jgi:hypothetical protein